MPKIKHTPSAMRAAVTIYHSFAALHQNIPDNCIPQIAGIIEQEIDINRRKLEAFDEVLRACKMAKRALWWSSDNCPDAKGDAKTDEAWDICEAAIAKAEEE